MKKDLSTRELLKRMRGKKTEIPTTVKETAKDLTMRDMLGKMRKINEDLNQKTDIDQGLEEKKMNQFFDDLNVDIEYEPLQVYEDGIFWGGTIDGQIQWVYKVAPTEEASGIEINYAEGFVETDPDNEEVVKRLEDYYSDFYKYWRDNQLEI